MDALARLAPGVTEKQAAARIANLGASLSHVAIGDDSVRAPVVQRASGALVETQRTYSPLARLLGAIAGVLLKFISLTALFAGAGASLSVIALLCMTRPALRGISLPGPVKA